MNAATVPAPVPEDILSEAVRRGRKKGGTRRGNVAIAPIVKRTKRMSRNRRLINLVMKNDSVMNEKSLPFSRTWNRNPLLDQVRSRKARGPSSETDNPECPLHAHALKERIQYEANHSTAESTRRIYDAIRDSTLRSEILRRRDGDDHKAETGSSGQ